MKILKQQILQSGVEKSTSCQEDSRVNLSPSQGEERERKTTAISGRKCYGQYRRSNPIGLLVRTLLESSRWYSPARRLNWVVQRLFSERITRTRRFNSNMSLRPCAKTLNTQDTLSSRYLFRLVPSERRTVGTGFGLLQTVQTQGLKVCNENGKTTFYQVGLLPTPRAVEVVEHPMKAAARTKDRTGTKLNNLSSGAAFGLLPTPTAIDSGSGRVNKSQSTNALERPTIAMAARMGILPAPKAQEVRGNVAMDRGKSNLTDEIANIYKPAGRNSQLNPLFVEEMMGFPLMWTTLPYLSRSGERNQSRPTETP